MTFGKVQGSDKDAWFGVQDARKRKVIQDRLAQRARSECFWEVCCK